MVLGAFFVVFGRFLVMLDELGGVLGSSLRQAGGMPADHFLVAANDRLRDASMKQK
jgi:hypothetical protein